MALDELLAALFSEGHDVTRQDNGLLFGRGKAQGTPVETLGIADHTPLGVEEAVKLADHVLDIIEGGGDEPILVLVDSDSQRMSRRDELLGLNEYLAHLAKCLILADHLGHRTVGLLYGHTAAGAFIATALATRVLVALPGAEPEVMDLPSIARVTKLSLDRLKKMAETTPVFAPGLDHLTQTGAVAEIWDPHERLDQRLADLLVRIQTDKGDHRDVLGAERGGRSKAAAIAARVAEETIRHG
jgi:malonate decarboxylase gamma subunit